MFARPGADYDGVKRSFIASKGSAMRLLPVLLLLLTACKSSGSSTAEDRVLKVVPVRHATAAELADELSRVTAPPISFGPEAEPTYVFVADARTNSLIVSTYPDNLQQILELIEQLDKNVEPKSN
jgi:type II secretory pathway component GspD/PulD (secretin)